jgi:hypothetical protein
MHSRSSSPDLPLVDLKGSSTAAQTKLDASSERSLDGKQEDQEHSRPDIAPFTPSTLASSAADRLQPVLTSLDPSTTPRPRHAAKRPPQVSSTQSSRCSSPSPQASAQRGRPPLRGRGGKRPAVKGRGRGRGRGSKSLVRTRVGHEDRSLSSTPTDLTDPEGSAESQDDDVKPHKQTTRGNSAGTDHGSRRSFPVSCVREMSPMHTPTLSSPGPAIHVTSPRNSVVPDPTTLVSQLNLTHGHSHQQLPSSTVPNLGIDPLSADFEPHPYLNGLEDAGSGIRFIGEIEQVIDGHFLESLTHGLYGSSASSFLDSDLMPM